MVVTDLMEFAVSYRGGAWTGIVVDIARAEPGESEIEWPQAIPLTQALGVTGPVELPCLPLRLHIAQKLHGMTLPPRPGKRNDRFRDLIDLLSRPHQCGNCQRLPPPHFCDLSAVGTINVGRTLGEADIETLQPATLAECGIW
jgi:hypothetical protein